MDGVIFSRVLPGQRALKDFVVLEDIAEDARNHLKTLNGIAVNGIPSATSMAAALTLHKLSLRVSEVVVGDKFKLDLLMFSEGKVPQMTSHDQWLQYSTMLLGTKRLALCVGIIAGRWGVEAVHSNGAVKQDLLRALRATSAQIDDLISHVSLMEENGGTMAAELDSLPLKPSRMDVKSYVLKVQVAVGTFSWSIIREMLRSGDKVVNDLVLSVPVYEHIVDDTKFLKTLARRNIIGQAEELKLQTAASVLTLNRYLSSIKQFHTEMKLEPHLDQDAEVKEAMAAMESQWTRGTKAMSVLAACKVILEMPKGKEQKADATFLLTSKKPYLPEILVKELTALSA